MANTLGEKNLLQRRKFFPFKSRPLFQWAWCRGEKTTQKLAENFQFVWIPHNRFWQLCSIYLIKYNPPNIETGPFSPSYASSYINFINHQMFFSIPTKYSLLKLSLYLLKSYKWPENRLCGSVKIIYGEKQIILVESMVKNR